MERIITVALQAADEANVHGKNITPFLLAKVKELTGGESFETNVQLALNNARCAAQCRGALRAEKKRNKKSAKELPFGGSLAVSGHTTKRKIRFVKE